MESSDIFPPAASASCKSLTTRPSIQLILLGFLSLILTDFKKTSVEANVICDETSMKVEVAKSSFSGHRETHLRLSDPTCKINDYNDTHVFATVPLNGCGTQMEEDNENLIFKNEITTVDDTNEIITRKKLVEFRFRCQYSKQGKVSQSFIAQRENITVWDRGLGTFTYQFEFYLDDKFSSRKSSYPLEYKLGEKMYMMIKATSQITNTKLFVETCKAAPYDTPNSKPTYSIIEDGCEVESTVQIDKSDSDPRQFKFSMEAFKFIGLHNQVYISCSVLMCKAGARGTRCSQRCINSGRSGSRGKREAVTQTARHFISQGPLRLRRSAERTEGPALNMNLNLVFIAGCLLAAVGMICGVVVYKTRVSKVKYQPLLVFES